MPSRNSWSDDEMVVVLDLYFKLPFRKLNKRTPAVKELANLIGRSDNTVAIRLTNYASCDPDVVNSGRHGMSDGRKRCMPYWEKYSSNKEELFYRAQEIRARYAGVPIDTQLAINSGDFIGMEREAIIRQRINQSSFRAMVLANYENKCAITDIDVPELLVASHIVPWAVDKNNRLNPANGICLSPLYDKMFDCGLIGIRDDYTVELSAELKENIGKEYYSEHVEIIKDKRLRLPTKNCPDLKLLEYHYNNIFAPHN